MKVLQLCPKPSYPVKDGGCLAINQISTALLTEGCELHILSICTPKHPFDRKNFPEGYVEKTNYQSIYVDTSLNAVDAFSNLMTQDTYHVSRFFSPDVDKKITQLLLDVEFDVVICESIFVTPYLDSIKRLSEARIVLRSHNLEFSIWHRLARSQPPGLKKAYLKVLTRQLRKYEIELLGEIDGLVAINADELKHYRRLGYKGAGLTIPFGVEPDKYTPDHTGRDINSVFHLGSMDWAPNEEGIKWFLDKVWPLVLKENKTIKLYLAGRKMPEWLMAFNCERVEVVGEVDDAQEFIKSKNIMVIPLLSGGGMRVKMIEAMALEKPVVSTPLGAKGIAVKNGDTAQLAGKPREFARAVLKLADNPVEAKQMAEAGRELIKKSYSTPKLARSLKGFLLKIS